MEKFGIGQAMRRVEDERFLKGEGRYIDDLQPERLAHAVAVRSPHAHARIESIDTSEAAAAPGVLRVLTIADCHEHGLGALPSMTAIDGLDKKTLNHPPRQALADGVARYVGEPVAFVVAETRRQALAAAELVLVEYEDLPAIVDLARTLDGDAPVIWEGGAGNRAFRFTKGDAEATEAALAASAHRVAIDLVNNRVAPNAIEPRGSIGDYDAGTGLHTLHLSGQAVHGQRNQLAADVFKVEPEKVRVVAADVGGGFGSKNFLYPENVLAMLAAKLLGRPVKWVAERAEVFLSEVHGRDHVTKAELGLDEEGRITALKVETIANMGAYLSTMAPVIPTQASWVSMGGVYRVPAIYMEVNAAYTNTMPVDAYRGAGRPEAAYIIERLIDVAAFDLDMRPDELRQRNYVSSFPYPMALGLSIDCGDFHGTYESAAKAADVAGFPARRAEARTRGRLRGLGVASYLEVTLGMPSENVEIRFEEDDTVTVLAGTQSTGQGHETAYKQIVYEVLGIAPEAVRFVNGDTARVASGGGHGGARSLMIGGSAALRGAESVREKGRAAAGHFLEAAADEIEFSEGLYAVRGTNRSIGIMELERALRDAPELPADMERTLSASGRFDRDKHSFPNGCHIAEVEVDPDTGSVTVERFTVVDDFGRIVNPLIASGQAMGGIAQGIGQALMEHVVYETESGQLLSGSLMDYTLPRADTLPAIELAFNESAPTGTNPLGVKGAGEAGATGAPVAIANAVMDALKPMGIRHLDMPLTSEKIWRALQAAEAEQQ